MKVDIWKDLAEKLAKRICPFIEFKDSRLPIEEGYMVKILEKTIKEFADERIVAFCFFAGEKDENTSEIG